MEKSKNSWQRNLTLSYTKRINYPFKTTNPNSANSFESFINNNTRLFDTKNNFSRVVKIDKIFKGVKTDLPLTFDEDVYKPLSSLNEVYNSSFNYRYTDEPKETPTQQQKQPPIDLKLITNFGYYNNVIDKEEEKGKEFYRYRLNNTDINTELGCK
jgi:alpha-acetolactate decarboxylase